MRDHTNERRPVVEGGAQNPGEKFSPIVAHEALLPRLLAADESLLIPTSEGDELARQAGGAFVAVVEVKGGKYRRRAYLTLASAERAARNAQAEGRSAVVYLAELKPLYRVVGGESR